MKTILSMFCRFLYKLMGWTYDELPDYWSPKSVVIGFPHTANMDTVRALAYIQLAKVNARLLVKSDWFFFPMSILLKSLGGMPVERNKTQGFVETIVQIFNDKEELVLALVPEGTRKNVTSIKTGFWYIAKGANVPIICWYLDNKTKRTCWLGRIEPGDCLEEDLLKIKQLYEAKGYSIPENKPVS